MGCPVFKGGGLLVSVYHEHSNCGLETENWCFVLICLKPLDPAAAQGIILGYRIYLMSPQRNWTANATSFTIPGFYTIISLAVIRLKLKHSILVREKLVKHAFEALKKFTQTIRAAIKILERHISIKIYDVKYRISRPNSQIWQSNSF